LPIQQSGFIVDERSCAVSFQAVILWLPLFTLRKGSQNLLSYTTRRGATGPFLDGSFRTSLVEFTEEEKATLPAFLEEAI
jgi:hypothetical protein